MGLPVGAGRPTLLDGLSSNISTLPLALLDQKVNEDMGCDHSASSLAHPEATHSVIIVGAIPCEKCYKLLCAY